MANVPTRPSEKLRKFCIERDKKNSIFYRLIETVLLSTHNILFCLKNKKNTFHSHTLIWGPIYKETNEMLTYIIQIL